MCSVMQIPPSFPPETQRKEKSAFLTKIKLKQAHKEAHVLG
jgi:hypothetical protein